MVAGFGCGDSGDGGGWVVGVVSKVVRGVKRSFFSFDSVFIFLNVIRTWSWKIRW